MGENLKDSNIFIPTRVGRLKGSDSAYGVNEPGDPSIEKIPKHKYRERVNLPDRSYDNIGPGS